MKTPVSGTTPGGAYSPGVIAEGRFLYVSGQGPVRDGETVSGTIEQETELVLENVARVLEAAGATLADVVRCGVFLADIDDFAAMNEVYASHVGDRPPARSTVEVAKLPSGARVEIEAIATA